MLIVIKTLHNMELVINHNSLIISNNAEEDGAITKQCIVYLPNHQYQYISKEEYMRILGILRILNGEYLRDIEKKILDDNVRKEFREHINGLFRMEIGDC